MYGTVSANEVIGTLQGWLPFVARRCSLYSRGGILPLDGGD